MLFIIYNKITNEGGDCMFRIPNITPLENLKQSTETYKEIIVYKNNNWAIGQKYPSGGPDGFSYFFSIRGIKIENYLRGTISIGYPTAYEKNLAALRQYINLAVRSEVALVDEEIRKIMFYKMKGWAIGEAYPNGGVDCFVVFFAERDLPIEPYLRGTVDIGNETAYLKNIETLKAYREEILKYTILI